MIEINRDDVVAAAYDAEIPEGDLREDYSGRGMGGAECFGIVGTARDLALFTMELTIRAKDYDVSSDKEGVTVDQVFEMFQRLSTDSMGRNTIFYFPGVQLVGEN